jgi:hypothetical protein
MSCDHIQLLTARARAATTARPTRDFPGMFQ